jgi:hypothetical protein
MRVHVDQTRCNPFALAINQFAARGQFQIAADRGDFAVAQQDVGAIKTLARAREYRGAANQGGSACGNHVGGRICRRHAGRNGHFGALAALGRGGGGCAARGAGSEGRECAEERQHGDRVSSGVHRHGEWFSGGSLR